MSNLGISSMSSSEDALGLRQESEGRWRRMTAQLASQWPKTRLLRAQLAQLFDNQLQQIDSTA
jgi:hypothetical protein